MIRNIKLYILSAIIGVIAPTQISAAEAERTDTTYILPWGQSLNYWQTTGNIRNAGEEQLERRTAGDLRNRLTGMLPGLEITENSGGLKPDGFQLFSLNNSMFNVSMKGFSGLICTVDDINIPFSQLLLDPNQIESITLLTDVLDKARIGPLASVGALQISTKNGGYNTPMQIRFDTEGGVSFAGKVTEWVNGEEYARLNNEARTASGYLPQYSQEALDGISQRDPYSLKYPNVDYKSLMYRNSLPLARAGLNIFGGGTNVKYNFSLNGLYSGSLINGAETNDFSKFNISSAIAAKVGNYIEVGVNFSTLLSFARSGRNDWYEYRVVPATAFPINLGKTTGEEGEESRIGTNVYPVSRTFGTNYYALSQEGGAQTNRLRSGFINVNLDIDMSWLLPGLKSRTYFSTSSCVQTTIGKQNDYLAYYWDSEAENGRGEISSHKGDKASSKSTLQNFTVQSLAFYERLSYERSFKKNRISAGATFTMNNFTSKGSAYYQRQMYLVADASYSYDRRYIAEFVVDYAGSSMFSKENRFAAFPAAGIAWVASNEEFLKGCDWLDNLKIHVQCGSSGQSNDVFGAPYLYRGDYSFANGIWYGALSSQDSYFGQYRWTSQTTTINRYQNPDLKWGKQFQTDAGIDFGFLKHFSFSVNYFYRKSDETIANIASAIPSVFGIGSADLYDNYTSESCKGVDVAFAWRQAFGDFRLGATASASSWETRYRKLVSDDYLYDYQKMTGTPTDSYFGLKCIGKFTDEAQLTSIPAYSSDAQVGDLMYQDVNGDGVVDTNDRINLGHTSPRLRYALNLEFGWKNLDIQIVGTGRAFFKTAMTNSYFWNGWGDGNYSAFVRDNIGNAYPRLSYIKSQNNFIASDFWLKDGGWFKIQDVEIAWTIPLKATNKMGLKSIRLNVKGQNLATLSKIKDVDPEAINSGVTAYPLLRTITAGFKLSF